MLKFPTSMFAMLKDLVNNGVWSLVGAGAPTDGTSGTGAANASPGSTYFDTTGRQLYVNIGTKASPIWLNAAPGVGELRHIRSRFTIAQVNAGVTLLPAIVGWKYRLADVGMISIGGAAGAVTTVDVLGTRAAGSVKLLAAAQANLTQSNLIRADDTGGTILADGASFTDLDDNTAITVGKTGASITTATHIDVLATYQLVKS